MGVCVDIQNVLCVSPFSTERGGTRMGRGMKKNTKEKKSCLERKCTEMQGEMDVRGR
jgi:hypothetical protein